MAQERLERPVSRSFQADQRSGFKSLVEFFAPRAMLRTQIELLPPMPPPASLDKHVSGVARCTPHSVTPPCCVRWHEHPKVPFLGESLRHLFFFLQENLSKRLQVSNS